MGCCQADDLDAEFDQRRAEDDRQRLVRDGPWKTTRMLLDALADVPAATVLDIGGGAGAIQLALAAKGLHVTSVEGSRHFLAVARSEATARGLHHSIRYLHGTYADRAADAGAADIVTLDRVVCCDDDPEALVGASARQARHAYGVVYPRVTPQNVIWWLAVNLVYIVRRATIRDYLYRPRRIRGLLTGAGLQRTYHGKTWLWHVEVFQRGAGT